MALVFISHSSEDRDVIENEIRPLLEDHGLSIWCSENDIPAAERFERTITRALNECDWFMVAMSASSAKSKWVHMEVHWAMDEKYDRVVPVMLGQVDLNDWHIGIRQLQLVDFTSRDRTAKQKLLAAFGITGGPIITPSDVAEEPGLEIEGSPITFPDGNTGVFQDRITLTGFDYFCYISQSKVEQLFSQIPPAELNSVVRDEEIKSRMAELNDKIASAERAEDNEIADLEQELAWLETARRLAGLEFGKKQANRFEGEGLPADGPTSLVKKTRNVLRYILMHKSVQDLMSVVHSGNNLNAFCYAYEGPHTFEDFAQPGMAIIRSKLGNRVLRQYCSLKYFSDMDFERKPDGTVEAHPHSLNFPFFQKTSGIAYTMISFLFVTGIKDNAIFGSPLCMILDSRKGIPL